MIRCVTWIAYTALLFGLCVVCAVEGISQEIIAPPLQPPQAPGDVPKGVEVVTRGQVHEAFASLSTEPKVTPLIGKQPPAPIEELPPEERPEGDVVWIGGYWAWDDDNSDFMWVSGCWRIKPTGREWAPGYWRGVGANHQWVPGFWTAASEGVANPVTYYPAPPAPPNLAAPGVPPNVDDFHIPGYWQWSSERYIWRAGYWTRVRPGYVYVPSHYRWTPSGHVFVAGYWDLSVSRRGLLYAPIRVDIVTVGARFRYTPYYAVRDTVVLDSLFVRPAFGAYYFGDYYGPHYVQIGFEPAVFYSRRHYEPLVVYDRWVYRDQPRWYDNRLTLVMERNAGRAPVPPRTLVQQNTILQKNVTNVTNVTNITNITNVIAPTKSVLAASGTRTLPVDNTTRAQVLQASQASHKAITSERKRSEATNFSSNTLTKPRTTNLNIPVTKTVESTTVANPIGSGSKGNVPLNPKIPPIGKGGTIDTGKNAGPPDFKSPTLNPPVTITNPPTIGTPPKDGTKGTTTVRPPLPKKTTEETKKKKQPGAMM